MRSSRAGYIDNSIVVWILLILVAILGPHLYREITGRTLASAVAALPPEWTSFLWRTLALVVAGGAAVAAGLAHRSRHPFRIGGDEDRVVLRLREPGLRLLAVALGGVALHALHFAWSVGGIGSWLLAGATFLLALPAGAAAASGERVVVEPGRVALERTGPGAGGAVAEHAWRGGVPAVELASHTTGGAFGQPLVERCRVVVGGTTLHESGDRALAEALREAVADALRRVGGPQSRQVGGPHPVQPGGPRSAPAGGPQSGQVPRSAQAGGPQSGQVRGAGPTEGAGEAEGTAAAEPAPERPERGDRSGPER